jgi:uncharacterized YigZ family protein
MLHTLVATARHSEDIRKSRFLAQATPVETPQQALAFVQTVSDATATHNCWAYRIDQAYRFNDDGEPSGTAGRPILQAIEGQGMDRVAVVVTRWYGGIKLGAGGLVRAYGGTAAECLRLAERTPIIAMTRLGVHCDFADLARMQARLKELGIAIEQENFDTTGVTLHLRLPQDQLAEARLRIVDISRGRSEAYELE